MIPAGIEPATFRFAAQHLNHCATAVPDLLITERNVPYRGGTFFGEEEKKNLSHGCHGVRTRGFFSSVMRLSVEIMFLLDKNRL